MTSAPSHDALQDSFPTRSTTTPTSGSHLSDHVTYAANLDLGATFRASSRARDSHLGGNGTMQLPYGQHKCCEYIPPRMNGPGLYTVGLANSRWT
jgi:hypothetical protein